MSDRRSAEPLASGDAREITTFAECLRDNERWLMQRILRYASDHGYAKYTSTLEDAWRMSVSGLSESLIRFVDSRGFDPELEVDEDVTSDPAVAFGTAEAIAHRSRGVSLQMFMSLMKYYRRSFLEMVRAQVSADLTPLYASAIERYFDRVEIGYCVEWSGLTTNAAFVELQEANRAIMNEKNKYLTLFQSLDAPVFLLNGEGLVENLNQSAARLLDTGDGVGEGYYSGIGVGGTLDMLAEDITALFESKRTEFWVERELETREGVRHYQVRLKRMLDVSGRHDGATVTLADVTQLKASNDHFYTLSNTDALTGLSNLRGLEIAVNELLPYGESGRADLVFMDLDGMKTINDVFGHEVGDATLKVFAEILKASFRSSDILARVGGDEFVGVLLSRDSGQTQVALDRLDAGIAARNAVGDLPCPIAVSFGIASCEARENPLGLQRMLHEADARMYTHKRLKRASHRPGPDGTPNDGTAESLSATAD